MKKLSLFGLFGLLAFVAMPIYAQNDLDAEDVVYNVETSTYGDDEVLPLGEDVSFDYGVDEDGVAYEMADDETDYYWDYDYSDYDSVSFDSGNMSIGTIALLGGLGLAGILFSFLAWVYGCLVILAQGEVYRKAGKKCWSFLVPFWGTMVYSEIAGMNKWWGIAPWLIVIAYLLGMPVMMSGSSAASRVLGVIVIVLSITTLIWLIMANYRVARRYSWGKFASVLHVLFSPITVLFLGLGKYQYQGNENVEAQTVIEA